MKSIEEKIYDALEAKKPCDSVLFKARAEMDAQTNTAQAGSNPKKQLNGRKKKHVWALVGSVALAAFLIVTVPLGIVYGTGGIGCAFFAPDGSPALSDAGAGAPPSTSNPEPGLSDSGDQNENNTESSESLNENNNNEVNMPDSSSG